MNKGIFSKTASVLFGIFLGVMLVVGGCSLAKNNQSAKSGTGQQITNKAVAAEPSDARNTPIVKAAKKVGPAVVGITNKALVRDIFNRVQLAELGTGSGVIYDKKGLIVTNNHVVEGAQEIVVSLSDGRSVSGQVLGVDAATDLAVVKIEADDLTVATFADSDQIMVGEPAIAIGNPLGLEFRGSVTAGVISALNRSVSETNEQTGETTESDAKLIQTDAAINPGNSGGALVNASGEVIGINSSKLVGDSVEGVGYAIPISDVSDLIQNLMNQATKTKVAEKDQGAIGIKGMSVPAEYSKQLNMPEGVYASEITKGGGAEAAGMAKGSVITAIDGTTVSSKDDLQEQLQYYAKGDKVSLTIQIPQSNGEYEEKTVEVTLGAK